MTNLIKTQALAAQMAGADRVLLEIRETPEKAFSDGQQTLNFTEATKTFSKLNLISKYKKEVLEQI